MKNKKVRHNVGSFHKKIIRRCICCMGKGWVYHYDSYFLGSERIVCEKCQGRGSR